MNANNFWINVCRVCESTLNLNNIFNEENKLILKKLKACANVLIDEADRLPNQICNLCIENLENAYSFKMLCEFSDRKFREIPNNLEKVKLEKVNNNDVIFDESNVIVEFEYNDIQTEDYTNVEHLIEEDNGVDEDPDELSILNNCNEENMESIKIEEISELDLENLKNTNVESCDIISDIEYVYKYIKSDATSVEYINNENDQQKVNKSLKLKKPFICETCNSEFINFNEFNLHKKSHGTARFQCQICEKWFPNRYYLKTHFLIHKGLKLFKCEQCNKRYSNHGNLDRHIRVFHNKERYHVCDKCGKSFSQMHILKQHYSVHIDERNFECEICHKKYKTQEYLNLHKDRHKPVEQRTIKKYKTSINKKKPPIKECVCSFCGKISNSVALHQSHIRVHTGERPYECHKCYKTFAFHQSLKTHLLLHTGEKPFKCDTCGVAFRQIGHLQGHKLVHTGEKLHKCSVCSKTFALRGNLTVHMRLHTGETPYHCTKCSKKFYDSNGLKRHKIVHLKKESLDRYVKDIESTDKQNVPNNNKHILETENVTSDYLIIEKNNKIES